MVSLTDAVLVLQPAATFGPDGTCRVADKGDGNGPQIVSWDPSLGPQPDAKQLAAVTPAQVTAYSQQQAQAAAAALLADPGATGTALRAIYLAAGLTPAQVQAQLAAASASGG